jgi:hypothetical protein
MARPVVTAHFKQQIIVRGIPLSSADVKASRPAPSSIEETTRGILMTFPARNQAEKERVILAPWSNVTTVVYGDEP